MKPEEQRIAIAEACGWRAFDDNQGSLIGVPSHNAHLPRSMAQRFVPDYLNDLNAMHQAERVMKVHQKWEYSKRLVDSNGTAVFATAAQRAETFLKCLGLWK